MDVNARTRISTAAVSREVSDWARTIVNTAADDFPPGELLRAARHLRLLALKVLDKAVLTERAAGATWAEVATAYGLPESEIISRYAKAYEGWVLACLDPDYDYRTFPAVTGGISLGVNDDVDPVGLADSLDLWRRRHADPWETAPGGSLSALLE